MSAKGRLRVCLAASAGGHLSQLLKLRPAWEALDFFFVTTNEAAAGQLRRDFNATVHVAVEANRTQPLKIARMLFQCARILLADKPDVVLSTGAAPGCLLSILGRFAGARVVWVDSIANVERISLSGRLVLPLADVFLTQWADLADSGRGIQYAGELT